MNDTTADRPSTYSPIPNGTEPVGTTASVPVRTPGSVHTSSATISVSAVDAATDVMATMATTPTRPPAPPPMTPTPPAPPPLPPLPPLPPPAAGPGPSPRRPPSDAQATAPRNGSTIATPASVIIVPPARPRRRPRPARPRRTRPRHRQAPRLPRG